MSVETEQPTQLQITRRLWDLAAPVIGLNVLNVLALAIDTAMCGRLPNADEALTALGFATQVVFILMIGMMGLTVGTVALVSRAHGARLKDRVNHILLQSTMLTVLLSITVAVLGNLLARPLIIVLGASDDVADLSLEYLRPLMTGTVFYYLNILYGAVLRGVGNTRIPFMVAMVSTATNVFLNYGFILGNMGFPALGVRGAAYGTLISYSLGVVLMVTILRRGTVEDLSLPLEPKPIDRALTREFISIGAPAAADMVILNVAFVSLVGMVSRFDEIAVAAHAIGLRIQALAFVPGMSVSQATGALVGQALGRDNIEEAKQVVRSSVVLSASIMTTLAITIIVCVHPIVALFEVVPGTVLSDYTVLWIRLLGAGMPIVGFYIAYVGMLQGAGATRTSLRINIVSTLLFQIPLSWLLGFPLGMGPMGVWLGFPLSFVLKALLVHAAYRRGHWARTGVTV